MGIVRGDTQAVVRAAWEELSQIRASGARVAVVYHADPDGLAAAAFMIDALQALEVSTPSARGVTTSAFDFESVLEWLRGEAPDCIIALDLNLSSREGVLARIARAAPLVLVYDDHVPRSEAWAANGPIHHYAAQERNGSVPACLFAYWLWRKWANDSDGATMVLATGLVADRAVRLAPWSASSGSPNMKLVRRVVRHISAYYAQHDLDPSQDAALAWAVRTVRSGEFVDSTPPFKDDFLADTDGLRRAVRALVESISQDLMRQAGYSDGYQVFVSRFEADYRIANLVASQGASIARSRPAARALVVACQQLPDATTMAELRIVNDEVLSLPALLEAVNDEVRLINFGGHSVAAGCRYWSGQHNEFVRSLVAHLHKDSDS